jgi:cephalosporin-C deacetylase-like acetyl esterase
MQLIPDEQPPPEVWSPLPRLGATEMVEPKRYSDEVWDTYVSLVSYEPIPLDSQVDFVDDSSPHWRMEKVSFTAAYDNERIVVYLFLPKNAALPYQVVVYFPGSGAEWLSSSRNGRNLAHMDKCDFYVKSGRAVVYPIYTGDHERGGGGSPFERRAAGGQERQIRVFKDLIRTLDYVESREDLDRDKIAYSCFSRGVYPGIGASVVDDRIKTAILMASGNVSNEFFFNSALRATIPVLMVSGRYDEIGPLETARVPFFEALATPSEHKRHAIFPCQHGLWDHRKEVIKESLAWLDKYLGPVERAGK